VPDLPRSHLVLYGLAALAVLAFGLRQVSREHEQAVPRAAPIRLEREPEAEGGRMVVHVAGAVVRPGVYRLRAGARVGEAVRRAGGALRRADLTLVNLAQELEDGRQVIVPARVRAPVAAAGGAPARAGPLNLNTATLEQLDALDGIGPVTAQKILDFRAEQGGFGDVEELDQIPGIGEATMATLREEATV
jgi:competence protein ComEA